MATDTLGNVAVDFVWGNMPMQPDDDRVTPLDPDLDSHVIATSGYNGFPDYTPVEPYLDDIANIAVPDVVGMLAAAAEAALEDPDVGLVYAAGATVDNAGGATVGNDLKAASQLPAAGTVVNVGTTVTVRHYAHT